MSPRKVRFDAWKRRPGRPTLVALLEAAQGRVFAICLDILRHREEAEEAAQETLLKIVEGIDQVADADHFERWIGVVATRTAIDRRRLLKRRRVRELAGTTLDRNTSSPVDGLQDALSRLPDEERSLLVERYFERRTLEEMADRRGVSDVAVRKRLTKAQDRLKRLLGGFFVWGAGVVKAKAAVGAVVLAMLLLGGTVFVATAKRESPVAAASKVTVGPSVEIEAPGAPPVPAPMIIPRPDQPLDHAALRVGIVSCWERLCYARARSAECRRIWPDSTTEEELRSLVNEKAQLDAEAPELYKRLEEMAARDPQTLIDVVKHDRHVKDRLRLMGLVTPDVEAEIASEEAPGGPLLSALLTLSIGDAEEKTYLAAFAGRLSSANRDVGKTLVAFLDDSDFHVRVHAAQSLESLASEGILREFMVEHISTLKRVALQDGDHLGSNVRDSSLRVLARMENESADEFVLQQLEGMAAGRDIHRVQAAAISASRLAANHETRLTMALVRALDLIPDASVYYMLLQVAASLPEGPRAAVARAAEMRKPEFPVGGIPLPHVTSSAPRNRIPRRNLTGVSRWEWNPSGSSEPMIRSAR